MFKKMAEQFHLFLTIDGFAPYVLVLVPAVSIFIQYLCALFILKIIRRQIFGLKFVGLLMWPTAPLIVVFDIM